MLRLAPKSLPAPQASAPSSIPLPKARVAILSGCAQSVLDPGINAATVRLLNRLGVEIVTPKGEGCCGALVHHMGKEEAALAFARSNVDAWTREIEGQGLDAIIITASGCGTTIKDYGHMLRLDPAYAAKAAKVSALTKDITEYLADAGPARAGEQNRPRSRLPFRLLHAARPENHQSPERPAQARRLHRQGPRRRPSVLRLGGHLQHPPARTSPASCGTGK